MNKIAQHTKLDEELVEEIPRWQRPDQITLPLTFEDWNLKQDITESYTQNQPKPTQPLSLKYPEISPETIKYRGLNPKELQRLRDSDDEDYKRHQESYWRKNQPFESGNKRYFELNTALPEEAKKRVIDKYNKFRVAAKEFQDKYNKANQIASQEVELNYSETYIDLFKNFSKFIVGNIHKYLGVLFGIVADFINRGINIFNITPFNIGTKLHEMSVAMRSMGSIIDEYERRKKVLKKLNQVELDVKRYLLKRDHRAFLKWMDEYFPNDKKEFMESAVKEVMDEYFSSTMSGFRLGSLKKIKTYSDIWYKAKSSASINLYLSMERKVEDEVKERLTDTVKERIIPKILAFGEIVNSATPEDMDNLIKYSYKNFKLDLKSIMNFVYVSMTRYYDLKNKDKLKETTDPQTRSVVDGGKENIEKIFILFKQSFITDIKKEVKEIIDAAILEKGSWKFKNLIESNVNEFLGKFFKYRTSVDYKELSKLTEQDINELISKYFRELIIRKLLNFYKPRDYANYDYTFPGFSGIGSILMDTGKFSIDSIINYVYNKVLFVPKEFLLNLVRALFKNQIPDAEEHNNTDKVFRSLYYLNGTSRATAMKIFLDLIKRSNKFNPNSFTNEYVKSFQQINNQVGSFIAEMKNKFSEADTIEVFSNLLRNTETVDRDIANANVFQEFIHNSAGDISKSDILKIIKNKNFPSYTKTGIVKKSFNTYAQIKNMGGIKGIYEKYGEFIKIMQQDGFISKNFNANINFIIKIFNSGEQISPASPFFRKLFDITSTIETDLQSIEMGEALSVMLKDYQKKDDRLFKLNLFVNNRLKFRVLKDKDPRMLRVGIESDCCQRIGGVGQNAARDSFINPLAGVLILEWKNNEGEWVLLSQSYFHYVPKDNGFILDNVERNRENVNKSDVDLSAAYAYLAQQTNAKESIGYFLSVKSNSKINTTHFKTKKLRGGDPKFFDRRYVT